MLPYTSFRGYLARPATFLPCLLLAVSSSSAAQEPPQWTLSLVQPPTACLEIGDRSLEELAKGSRLAFGLASISRYEWDSHTFSLTRPENSESWQAWFDQVGGRAFVVSALGEPVFVGAFKSPFSSIPCPLPVIIQPTFDPSGQIELSITLGYPSEKFHVGDDPRSSPSIRRALAEAGKLEGVASEAQ